MQEKRFAGLLRGLRVVLALASLFVAYRGHLLIARYRVTESLYYFMVATGMLLLAGILRGQPKSPAPGAPPSPKFLRVPGTLGYVSLTTLGRFGLVVVALAIGCVFRLYEIGSQPWGVWFDEAQNGIVAQQILNDPHYRPVFIPNLSQLPALFFYVFAVAIKLLGANITALRLVTTLAGLLTLIFIYLLSRELFDERVALLAAVILAAMRWHVNFSRFAMHGVFMPLFMTATLYFLVRGLKGKNIGNFLLAGVMAGIGLQGYYAFLFVPIVIAAYLVHYAMFERSVGWGRLTLGTLMMVAATAIVYSPVAIWASHHPSEFAQRLGTASIIQGRTVEQLAEVVWGSTQKHLLMFTTRGDFNGRHNLPGAPMLDPYTGFLMILGVGYCIGRLHRSGNFLLLVWMIIVLQAGIWSVDFEAPQAYRTIGLTAAVAMLAALPLGLLVDLTLDVAMAPAPAGRHWLIRAGGLAGRGLVVLATGAVLAFLLTQIVRINFQTYFGQQLKSAGAWASYSTDATFVGQELARFGSPTNRSQYDVYCSPFIDGLPTVIFLASEVPPPHRLDIAHDLPLKTTKSAVFLLSHEERTVLDLLKTYYPNATFTEFGPPDGGSPIVFEAVIGAQDIEATRGLAYRYTSEGAVQEGRVPAVTLDWGAAAPLPLPLEAEWTGVLNVPKYGPYVLEVHAPGSIELQIDGEARAQGNDSARTQVLTLPEGLHEIRVHAQIHALGSIQLLWGRTDTDLRPIPAAQLFSGRVKRQGLEGRYLKGAPGSALAFVRIDPVVGGHLHILPLDVPFTIQWRGQIHAPASGKYTFDVQAVDEGRLRIDDKDLLATPAPNDTAHGTLDLGAGLHNIELTFEQRGGSPAYISLFWTPPTGGFGLVPTNVLSPPLGGTFQSSIPEEPPKPAPVEGEGE